MTDKTLGISESFLKRALAFRYQAETRLHPDQVEPTPLEPYRVGNVVPFPIQKKEADGDD